MTPYSVPRMNRLVRGVEVTIQADVSLSVASIKLHEVND